MRKAYILISALLGINQVYGNSRQTGTIHDGLLQANANRASYKKAIITSKYAISLNQSFQNNRNHYALLDSKMQGTTTALSLDTYAQSKWAWGINYLYMQNKTTTYFNNGVLRTATHSVVPYGVHFISPNAYVDGFIGGITSKLKINQPMNSTMVGASSRAFAGIGGANITTGQTYGLWHPSVSMGGLFYESRTNKYTFSNGVSNKAQRIHFLQGQTSARLQMRAHRYCQPYVRAGYNLLLRRSSDYLIEDWKGWLLAGGVNFVATENMSAGIDCTYQKLSTGARQNSIMFRIRAQL